MHLPHCTPSAAWISASPARLASRIATDSPRGCRAAFIGLADDLGVRLNSGRAGAAGGPDAIRAALCGYGVAEPHGFDFPRVFDAGNITPATGNDAAALLETHRRVRETVRDVVAAGLFPIGLGGGHDLTLPFVAGVIDASRQKGVAPPLAGRYFDAHLDVRDTTGSGMPFRRLIEDHGVKSLTITGFNPFANAREHVAWFLDRGGVIERDARWTPPTSPCFVSLDLDVLDAAHAPGVSAVNPAGLAPSSLQPLIEAAGACPFVACFDVMELCPVHDQGARTARLAAHMVLAFLRGMASRPESAR
ncbi:MAG: arginase family protein [Phycisphaerales bacterium]